MDKRRLKIDVEDVEGVTIITLSGAIDAASVGDFRDVLQRAGGDARPRILLDCAELSYVNSTSFGLFYKFHRECEEKGGRLALCEVWDKIMTIIALLGLDEFLDTYPSKQAALDGLNAG